MKNSITALFLLLSCSAFAQNLGDLLSDKTFTQSIDHVAKGGMITLGECDRPFVAPFPLRVLSVTYRVQGGNLTVSLVKETDLNTTLLAATTQNSVTVDDMPFTLGEGIALHSRISAIIGQTSMTTPHLVTTTIVYEKL